MTSPIEGYMHDIKATRVSLVKRPANGCEFLITKKESNTMDEIIQIITDTEANDETELVAAFKANGKDDKAVEAALAIYRTLNAFRDSLDESDLDAITKSLGYETDSPESEVVEEVDDVVVTADEEIVKAEEESVDNGEVPVEGDVQVDSAVDGVLNALREEVNALKADKRKAELEVMLAGVKVGKSTEELVDMLMTIDNAGGDVSIMVDTLKSVSSIAKAGLFEELGSDGTGAAGDAYHAMKSAAEALAVEDGTGYAQALAKLHEVRPELIEAYTNEVK